ncbi:hypothetical protein [Lactococcus protaetiae]|uniref:Uncharacterized protein n=1 Tax=Lactococcus protaetiae TaxID=2592653 RepID=A0A514Z6F1_9LACT|nr:hypothetical protein [Lactococcus protaetiae]QDK70185.1 hypothetical protein FLP15_02055 [Lactococcus protaetiae]
MTKEEWKQAFRQMNGREPSVEEFLKAKENGEFEFEETLEDKTENISKLDAVSLKQRFGGKNKQYIILAGSIVFIIVLIIGVFSFVNSRPKNIITNIDVKYSGYNKLGIAVLSENYKNEMEAIIAKKVGYSSSDVDAVKKGNDDVLTANITKMAQLTKYLDDTVVKLSKDNNLSNGDKITLSVTTSLKDNPIKSAKKALTVSGLEKSTVYKISDIIKKYPIKVIGYNHFGSLTYNDEIFNLSQTTDSYLADEGGKNLTNGDSVKMYLSNSYVAALAKKGFILSGKGDTTIKVSGLLDSPKISNLNDLLSQIDTVVRSDKKSDDYDTYTITRQESYFIGENIQDSNSEVFL